MAIFFPFFLGKTLCSSNKKDLIQDLLICPQCLWNLKLAQKCQSNSTKQPAPRKQAHLQKQSSSIRLQNHLPDSLSAVSSLGCCTSLCQSKPLPRACPGSPDLCRSDRFSPSLSWTLVSYRWIPSGHICSAFSQSEAVHCS